MRGDSVSVLVDVGAGECREFVISATKNRRTVEVENKRGMIEVSEVKSGGKPVHTDRFMATRVVALVESRSEDPEAEIGLFPIGGDAA